MTKMTQPKISSKSGKLYISFSLNGKQQRRLSDTKKNRNLAETKTIPALMYKINFREFFKNKNVKTVDEMMQISMEIHKNNRRSFTTKNYICSYNLHIKPYFGNKDISTIKPSELYKWQNELFDKNLSTKTIGGIRTVFNSIFDAARKDEVIDKNPFSSVDRLKKNETNDTQPFLIEDI